MEIKPIRTEEEYEAALKEIEYLFEAKPDTVESDRLDVLAALVEAHEAQHYPIPLPDPIAAIAYHMESRGLTVQDLVPYIGTRRAVEEVLQRKRPLSIEMIRRLHELGISADVLIQDYPLLETAS